MIGLMLYHIILPPVQGEIKVALDTAEKRQIPTHLFYHQPGKAVVDKKKGPIGPFFSYSSFLIFLLKTVRTSSSCAS